MSFKIIFLLIAKMVPIDSETDDMINFDMIYTQKLCEISCKRWFNKDVKIPICFLQVAKRYQKVKREEDHLEDSSDLSLVDTSFLAVKYLESIG